MSGDPRAASIEQNRWLADAFDKAATELGAKVDTAGSARPGRLSDRRRKRGSNLGADDTRIMLIVERDGVLHLGEGPHRRNAGGLRRRASHTLLGDNVVTKMEVAKLGRNQIVSAIGALDKKLTGSFGLLEYRDGELVSADRPPADGRLLLFVHGTFSDSAALFAQLEETEAGKAFLAKAKDRYDKILAFNHRTLSMSPMLNARELAMLFEGCQANVDIVCHSRGGLVVRWWLEAFDRRDPTLSQVVFLGCPLNGTGLAAPSNLRSSLGLISNFAKGLKVASNMASAAVPLLTFVTGIFQVVSSVTSFAAKTPVIDAAVAMVPGLAAMSRIENNWERLSLRERTLLEGRRYAAVRSNFEPKDEGWRFWRNFRNIKGRAADLMADTVFDGDNDLVVDTSSMTSLTDEIAILDGDQLCDFGTSEDVHHTNYLRQERTVQFLENRFQLQTG